MTSETVTLPAGQVLTVTAASGFNGTLWRMVAGVSAGSNVVASGSSVAVGPFVSDAQFRIDSDRGQLSYANVAHATATTNTFTGTLTVLWSNLGDF